MTLKEYTRWQELSIEMHDLVVTTIPERITKDEVGQLKELLVPHGRLFATSGRHLEFILLSSKFALAVRDGRVCMSLFQGTGRNHTEVEILPPV